MRMHDPSCKKVRNPVSLEPARWQAANRRDCESRFLCHTGSVVMAGGTSRPRAVGDVTSVYTGSSNGSIPLKRNRGGIQESVLCVRLGTMGHATFPLRVVKLDTAPIRLHLLQTLHLHLREFRNRTRRSHGIHEKSDVMVPTIIQTFLLRLVTLARTVINNYKLRLSICGRVRKIAKSDY
jgi:hypothetical protein